MNKIEIESGLTNSIYDNVSQFNFLTLNKTSYMDIASYHLDSLDQLMDRIDNHQDVDVALISEDIVNGIPFALKRLKDGRFIK